jgi:ribosomal protein L25 (general stress protein Ctc)
MDAVEITIERRTDTGKGSMRRLRRTGIVPAVFYGPKRSTVSINVNATEFEKKLLHLEGSHLIRLIHGGGDAELHDKMALLREKQLHPVTGLVLHADFYEVDLTERLAVSVSAAFHRQARRRRAGRHPATHFARDRGRVSADRDPRVHRCRRVTTRNPRGAARLRSHAACRRDIGGDSTRTVVTVVPPTVEETKPAEAAEAAPVEGAPAEGAAAAAPAAETPPTKKGGAEG